jgi:hypothetical protein
MTMPLLPIALALAQFAPSIMRFFGVGESSVAIAEKVVGIAQTVTGAKTPEEALAVIRENAQLAQQFNFAVLAADTDLEKAFLADRQDARSRDIELRKLTGGGNRRADIMIICDWLGMISCLVAMVYITKLGLGVGEDGANPIVMAMNGPLGMLTQQFANGLRDAHQFEFGSSRGSKEKDELLSAKLAPR